MSLNNPNEIQIFDNSKTKQLITRIVILELLIDIALVILIVLCAYHASAYDPEGGLNESEMYSVIFNPDYAYDGSMDNPVWYQPIKDYLYKFNAYFTSNAPTADVTIAVRKITWDYNTEEYIPTTHVWNMSTHYVFYSNETSAPASELDPVKEYFKNNTEDINDFTPVGQGDHPDILNVTIDINGNGTTLDKSTQGYVAMTQDDLTQMKSTIGGQDYGFSLSGMGGEGGIGEVYASVGTGGERSAGMSNIFKYLFYALIPILFILSIFNMITKIFS